MHQTISNRFLTGTGYQYPSLDSNNGFVLLRPYWLECSLFWFTSAEMLLSAHFFFSLLTLDLFVCTFHYILI